MNGRLGWFRLTCQQSHGEVQVALPTVTCATISMAVSQEWLVLFQTGLAMVIDMVIVAS